MYLSRKMVVNTILKINEFKTRLEILYDDFDIDVNENTGRRNALLSAIQEKVLSDELSLVYENVENDGAPGKPDIVIGEIDTELECKLTSGSGSKSRSYSLQTDYATIQNKEKLDYLYIVTNKDMTAYSVLYFNGLTADDFCIPSETARGKSRMSKKVAFKKATPLIGSFVNLNQGYIDTYKQRLEEARQNNETKINEYCYDFLSYVNNCKIERFVSNVNKANDSYNTKARRLNEKIALWESKDDSYSIKFESIKEIKKQINKETNKEETSGGTHWWD
jgi:hypothetical protein